MSVEQVKNMLPFTVAEEKSPTLQTLLGLCLQETTLISLLIWYSTFYRVLPVNSFYRWFLPVNRWSGRFAKFTSLLVAFSVTSPQSSGKKNSRAVVVQLMSACVSL